MPRLHTGTYTQLGVARQVLGLDSFVVLHGMSAFAPAMEAFSFFKAIKNKAHGAVADCVDARVHTPLSRLENGGADALGVLGGLAARLGGI